MFWRRYHFAREQGGSVADLYRAGDELVLALSAIERAEALHGDVRIPLRAVRSIEALDHLLDALHGMRAPGRRFPARSRSGPFAAARSGSLRSCTATPAAACGSASRVPPLGLENRLSDSVVRRGALSAHPRVAGRSGSSVDATSAKSRAPWSGQEQCARRVGAAWLAPMRGPRRKNLRLVGRRDRHDALVVEEGPATERRVTAVGSMGRPREARSDLQRFAENGTSRGQQPAWPHARCRVPCSLAEVRLAVPS